ncbi:MAG: diphosphomevalonate decarboxylase [Anaerolineales bacterium]
MFPNATARAIAHPNIALIKYWGNRDDQYHIPFHDSISFNLGALYTQIQVTLDTRYKQDQLIMNGEPANSQAHLRVSQFLDYFRHQSGVQGHCKIESTNNFPTAAGIASSAAAFAALTLAAAKVYQLELDPRQLSQIARLGSGSACRSVPGGFVQWIAGHDHQSSYAESFAPPHHWDLIDCIAIIGDEQKKISSLEGHRLAHTSPIQSARLESAASRVNACRSAIEEKDFPKLTEVVELDSNLMHAVMMTSSPPIFYWEPPTIAVIKQVQHWRMEGLPTLYTIDAGASVHVICPTQFAAQIYELLGKIPGVKSVISSGVGGAAQLLE